jgi:hypothetical protein
MQTRTRTYLATIALFVAPAVSGLVQAQQRTNQPPNYFVINLGDPLGVPSAAAASIYDIGWILPSLLWRVRRGSSIRLDKKAF